MGNEARPTSEGKGWWRDKAERFSQQRGKQREGREGGGTTGDKSGRKQARATAETQSAVTAGRPREAGRRAPLYAAPPLDPQRAPLPGLRGPRW